MRRRERHFGGRGQQADWPAWRHQTPPLRRDDRALSLQGRLVDRRLRHNSGPRTDRPRVPPARRLSGRVLLLHDFLHLRAAKRRRCRCAACRRPRDIARPSWSRRRRCGRMPERCSGDFRRRDIGALEHLLADDELDDLSIGVVFNVVHTCGTPILVSRHCDRARSATAH